jgi:hypothetical protein
VQHVAWELPEEAAHIAAVVGVGIGAVAMGVVHTAAVATAAVRTVAVGAEGGMKAWSRLAVE